MSGGFAEELRTHRAQRRQRTLDMLRELAKTSTSARRLLAQIDPDGVLQFTDEKGRPLERIPSKP